MHEKFEAWRRAMQDLEETSRQSLGPQMQADAVRRAAETHEAVLRQMVIDLDRLRRAITANVDRTQSAISEESMHLSERIDGLAARLHQAEQAIASLQEAAAELRRAAELGGQNSE